MRIAGFALLTFAACTSAPNTTPDPAARPSDVQVTGHSGGAVRSAIRVNPSYDVAFDTIQASVDRVWDALPAIYTALSMPLTVADNKARRLGNEGMKTRRRLGDTPLMKLLDCGRSQIGENAESYEITLSVVTTLQVLNAQTTRVSTSVEASAKPIQFAGAEIGCRTKGELERQIALALRARTAG